MAYHLLTFHRPSSLLPIGITACVIVLGCRTPARAETGDTTKRNIPVYVDLALVELPFNARFGGRWPSMAEARTLAASAHELSGCLIDRAVRGIRSPIARIGATAGLEAFELLASTYLPCGITWMHEEYHRAVLSNRGIDSYDGLYNFNPDITTISVSRVSDEALVNLKAGHPGELVRLESAGYEANVALADALLRDRLIRGARLVEPAAWCCLLSNTFYLYYCTTAGADAEVREFNATETAVDQRDAIGWDYPAWVYDLHRPDEPYDARGPHPSGAGINRYVLWSQLAPREQEYLRLQGHLSWVNLLRPQLFGLPPWRTNSPSGPIAVIGGLRHELAPFGFGIGVYAAALGRATGAVAAINVFAGEHLALPGIDCGLVDVPVAGRRLLWSPRLSLWLQPRDMRYDCRSVEAGILASQRLELRPVPILGAYAELEAKTHGWVSGVEEIEAGFSVRAGCVADVR